MWDKSPHVKCSQSSELGKFDILPCYVSFFPFLPSLLLISANHFSYVDCNTIFLNTIASCNLVLQVLNPQTHHFQPKYLPSFQSYHTGFHASVIYSTHLLYILPYSVTIITQTFAKAFTHPPLAVSLFSYCNDTLILKTTSYMSHSFPCFPIPLLQIPSV